MTSQTPPASGGGSSADMVRLTVASLKALEAHVGEYSAFADDFLFTHITPERNPFHVFAGGKRPAVAYDGMVMLLCMAGRMRLESDGQPVELRPDMLSILREGSVNTFEEASPDFDGYMLFVGREFIESAHFDPMVVLSLPFGKSQPGIPLQLTAREHLIFKRYVQLLRDVARLRTDPLYVRSIARCLVEALFYQLIQAVHDKTVPPEARSAGAAREAAPTRRPARRNSSYVEEFMKLVNRHHTRERTVIFYARQLCITPKYLSMLVKQATGRSASEWIDDIVLLEAKNMLRFSGRNVQQVAYALNFPNQSAFGKYFKSLTGMSPLAFQRGQ